jgi:hypothetical protein
VDKVSTIEGDLNTASTGLKARVTALEGKDTVIIEPAYITYNNDGNPTGIYEDTNHNTPITPT